MLLSKTTLFMVSIFTALASGCATIPEIHHDDFWGKTSSVSRQGKAYAHHISGVIHERRGDLNEAVKNWEKVLEIDPTALPPRFRMIRAYLRQGDMDRAILCCEKALEQDPERAELWITLGEMRHAQGDVQAATRSFEKAIELRPDDMLGYGALVELQESTNDLVAAIEIYERLIRNSPDSAALYYQLGTNLARIKDSAGARDAFEKVLELEPRISRARLLLALVLFDLNETDRCAEELRLYLAERPGDVVALQYHAGVLLRLDRADEARATLQKLLACKEATEKNILQWALFLGMQGNFEEASKTALTGGAPLLADCYSRMHTQNQDFTSDKNTVPEMKNFLSIEEVEGECDRIMDALSGFLGGESLANALYESLRPLASPESTGNRILFMQARLLLYLERTEEALALLNQVRAEGISEKYVLYHKALSSDTLGDKAGAETYLRAYLQIDPDNPDILNFLGYLYAQQNRNLEEAMQLLNRALNLDPKNPYYLDSLGWVYYRMGRFEEAAELIRKAIYGMDTDDAVLREHLGDIYQAQGDLKRALGEWRRAVRLDPNLEGVRKKLEQFGGSEPES